MSKIAVCVLCIALAGIPCKSYHRYCILLSVVILRILRILMLLELFSLSPIVSVLAYYHKAPMDGKSLSALLPMVIEWGSGLGTLWSLRGKK